MTETPEARGGVLVSTWEAIIKNADDEAEIHELHKYVYPQTLENPFITQAAPTVIRPSKATKPERTDHQLIASVPDIQYGYRHIADGVYEPLHDPRALSVARTILRSVRPDVIVLQGDLLDAGEVSKYEPDSTHFSDTLQMSINGLHSYLAGIRADNPDSKIVALAGNHDERLKKKILRHTTQVAGIKRANMPEEWNVLSVPFLLRLDELEITYLGGYPANEYRYSDNVTFIHGNEIRSGGSTAELYSKKYPDTNVFFGHIHRHEEHTRTTRNGQYLLSATFGTLSRIDGAVPSYGSGVDDIGNVVTKYENWQQGMGLIYVYENGEVQAQFIPIKNGIARVNGRQYQ